MGSKSNIIAALDFGTSTIRILAATRADAKSKRYKLLGSVAVPAQGLRKGIVINIDPVVDSITEALHALEKQIGSKISEVVISISGSHLESFNLVGEHQVRSTEVNFSDIRKAIEKAQSIALERDREVLHILPQEYIVDGQDGIRVPEGMSCRKLAVRVHLVTGSETASRNFVKCANRAGLTVTDLVAAPVAIWKALPTVDEQELGVAVVDIGAGTTDLAVIFRGALVLSATFPLGGNHISSDLATGLKIPLLAAEEIKCQYGCAWQSFVSAHEQVEIKDLSGNSSQLVSRMQIAEIVEARVIEILGLVEKHLQETGAKALIHAGVLLTGGSAKLTGIAKAAERVFSTNVRVAEPKTADERKLELGFANTLGLIEYAYTHQSTNASFKPEKGIKKVFSQLNSWFSDNI